MTRKVRIEAGGMGFVIAVPDGGPVPFTIVVKIELVDPDSITKLSQAVRVIEVHGDHIIVN